MEDVSITKTSIAVIDSGVGGLLVLEALVKQMPEQSFVYVGDQKNAPYGIKTKEQLLAYNTRIISWLASQGIDTIVVACNTSCSTVLPELRQAFPKITFYGIIEVTCEQIDAAISKAVLVLATKATIQARGYEAVIESLYPSMQLYSEAAGEYVVAVEEGASEDEFRRITELHLRPYIGLIDTIILGCTHFPYAVSYMRELFDGSIMNSNDAIANHVAVCEANRPKAKERTLIFYTTKDEMQFQLQVQKIFQNPTAVCLLEVL